MGSFSKIIFCLIFTFIYVAASRDEYVVPKAKVEVFSPRGFRVSIEDSPGIRLFAFHGSINVELRDLEAGVFSKDILHKRRGRWTFEERRTKVHVGDVIYYWIFVIKSGLGYRLDDQKFIVTELINNNSQNSNHDTDNTSSNKLPTRPETCNQSTETGVTLSQDNDMSSHLQVCEQTVLNITQVLLNLQEQNELLELKNQQLIKLIEKYPDSRSLTLSGVIPTSGDPVTTVSFVIREKLGLNPDIVAASRVSDNVITFKVSSLDEKLAILRAAKEMLIHSRIVIS